MKKKNWIWREEREREYRRRGHGGREVGCEELEAMKRAWPHRWPGIMTVTVKECALPLGVLF